MSTQRITRFKQKYETLSGKVKVVGSLGEAAEQVIGIVGDASARRVALGRLPQPFHGALREGLVGRTVEVLEPPFDRADLPHIIDTADVGVSEACFAIAESGTLVEFTTDDALRLVSTLPRIHVGLVSACEVMDTLMEAAPRIRAFLAQQSRHASVTFISGPSRSADIEMRLTLGVHGPEIAHAVIVQDMDA